MPLFGGLEEVFAPATMIAGALVATVAIVVAAIALRSFFAAGEALDGTARLFGRRPRSVDHWLCRRCRSYNRADQTRCYRGCGAREEVEEVADVVDAGTDAEMTPGIGTTSEAADDAGDSAGSGQGAPPRS